ncbi:HAD family hydrolase [Paenibacillus senegalensis]|uniref:HAD family hydrolase n=1 Tax=Paenibacillus senegalensis TaxID=1465766 RepID=UPI00028A3C2A|nr:HAD family hydrolase [Paenibacillus senegalensis]
MTPQILLFDMDDTLIHCNKYFQRIIDRFSEQMSEWFSAEGLDSEAVKAKQLEIDIEGVTRKGFVENHFPESLVDTYRYFCDYYGTPQHSARIDGLFRLGRTVYDMKVEPYPYMQETLQNLTRDGHELYLYTGGVPSIQQDKIAAAGLETFFEDRIFIRQHKNTEALQQILQDTGFDRSRTWMIGNSMRTDVLPALENGIHSIYLPAQLEWQFNVVEIKVKPAGAYLQLSSLRELQPAIRSYTQQLEDSAKPVQSGNN